VVTRCDRRSVGPSSRRGRSARLGGDPVGVEPRGPYFHGVGHAPPHGDHARHHSPDDEHDAADHDGDNQPYNKPDDDPAAPDDDSAAAAHDRPDHRATTHDRPDHSATHDDGHTDDDSDYRDSVTA
jgi:hypothetical protein